jgi:acetyl esterase
LRSLILIFYILTLSACSNKDVEPLENNDPSKYNLAKDVLWASPNSFDLTMDIYTPTSGKDAYPVLLIFHGGGWLINDKSIMDQASSYLATNSEYVICNVNYRLLADQDNTVTIDQIVGDAFGAVLWVKAHIGVYGGDANKVAVTGDSAGAHLAAMIVNSGHQLGSDAYSELSPLFIPSYLQDGITAEVVAEQRGLSVQAAILSYGAFDLYSPDMRDIESWKNPFWLVAGSLARGLFGDDFHAEDNPIMYQGVSPIYNIPAIEELVLPPQLLTVGSDDPLVSPASVSAYLAKLQNAGHSAQYWEYEGRSHAFLDSGSNALLASSFEKDAPVALDIMIDFLDEVFYQ